MQLDENEMGTWSKVLINLKVFFFSTALDDKFDLLTHPNTMDDRM